MMINNLNLIARVDQSLNTLMKIVASGDALNEQIIEFQGYIQRAKEMGDGGLANYRPPARPIPAHLMGYPHAYGVPEVRRVGRPPKPRPLGPDGLPLPAPPRGVRPVKPPRDQRLTAFQEKYLYDANLVFEFAEVPNMRYWIPKDAVCEITLEHKKQLEGPLAPPNQPDDGEMLVSFMYIHNYEEMDRYERDKAAWDAREEQRRVEKEKAEQAEKAAKEGGEVKQEDGVPAALDVPVRRPRKKAARFGRRSTRAKAAAPLDDELDTDADPCPVEPVAEYLPMTIRFLKMPRRYLPVLGNSFRPAEKVVAKMEHIMGHGTRLTEHYLWNQLDGKRDRQLAEELREALAEADKTGGVVKRSRWKRAKKPALGTPEPDA